MWIRWILLGIGALACCAAGARAEDPATLFGAAQGTTYSIKLSGLPAGFDLNSLHREIESLLAEFDRQVSTYRDDSELSRFNADRGEDWFPVSATTAAVVQRGLDMAAQSGGAFDPTVVPLLSLWNFDRKSRDLKLPDEAAIAAARAHVGYQRLQVRLDPPALRKSDPELAVNLNAIAQGYSVDLVADLLRSHQITNFMVEIGGEILTSGHKPDGSFWRIGIERPGAGEGVLQAALPLDNAAISTSGDYRQFYELNGIRYSHTMDPRTGRPVQHALASVTIVAEDCATADGLSTTLMVLGPEAGLQFAEEHGIAAWLLTRGPDHKLQVHASSAFLNGPGKSLLDLTDRTTAEQHATADQKKDERQQDAVAPAKRADTSWLTIVLAAVVFTCAVIGLAAGLVLRGKPLPGSCGGLAGMKDERGRPICPSCTIPPEKCDEFRRQIGEAAGQCEDHDSADAHSSQSPKTS